MTSINETALNNLCEEVALVTCKDISEFVLSAVGSTPGDFWQKPSAFVAGHHPDDELIEWGNLRHVKRVFTIAVILADSAALNCYARDILFASVILHDIGKYGTDGTSIKIRRDHPSLVHCILNRGDLPENIFRDIMNVIESHMGRWGTPLPSTDIGWLCHYADCIASKTTVNIPVELRLVEHNG